MTASTKASKAESGLLSFEPNSLLQAADGQIASLEYSRATQEASWDGEILEQALCYSGMVSHLTMSSISGYCGLVKVGEEEYGASSNTHACIDKEAPKDSQRHKVKDGQTEAS